MYGAGKRYPSPCSHSLPSSLLPICPSGRIQPEIQQTGCWGDEFCRGQSPWAQNRAENPSGWGQAENKWCRVFLRSHSGAKTALGRKNTVFKIFRFTYFMVFGWFGLCVGFYFLNVQRHFGLVWGYDHMQMHLLSQLPFVSCRYTFIN